MKLSIIVPLYNVEQYAKDCFDSIIASDLPKDSYEVIIVNDGSTDSSPNIAKQYVDENPYFRYTEQENQGLSVARNTGIKIAKGEYIWFVDSDDLIAKDIIPVFKMLDDSFYDIIECRLHVFNNNDDFVIEQLDGKKESKTGPRFIIDGYWPGSVCTKFIKKSFLTDNDMWFVPGLIHQDTELSYRMYSRAENVCFFNYYIYHYRYNPQSLSRSKKPIKLFNNIKSTIYISKVFENLADDFHDKNYEMSEVIRRNAKSMQIVQVWEMFRKKKYFKEQGIYQQLMNELKNQSVYPLKGNFYSLKKNLLAKILNFEFLLK